MEVQIAQEQTKGSAYIESAEGKLAEMTFSKAGDSLIIIDHTEVSEALRGQGAGKQLLMKLVEHARENGIKILPLCPFAKSVFTKDKSIADVLK